MRILAIDPGRRSGWALYDNGELVESGATKRTVDDGELWQMAFDVIARCCSLDLMVIEDQYVAKFLKSALSVARSAQTWACMAYHRGIPVSHVQAAEWQALLCLPKGAHRNRDMLASATNTLAQRIAGRPIKTPDEASAICIGAWAIQGATVPQAEPPPKAKATRKAKASKSHCDETAHYRAVVS